MRGRPGPGGGGSRGQRWCWDSFPQSIHCRAVSYVHEEGEEEEGAKGEKSLKGRISLHVVALRGGLGGGYFFS